MLTSLRSIFFSRRAIWIYCVESFFLGASIYGLGRGANDFFATGATDPAPLVFMVFCGIAPLTIFIFIAVNEAVGAAKKWASASYQHRIDELQKRINAQDDFHGAMNNNLPTTLTIYDRNNAYWYVNASAARSLGFPVADIPGRHPAYVTGAERGAKIVKLLQEIWTSNAPREIMEQFKDAQGELRYIQTYYQILAPYGEFPGGIMARGENVTSIITERGRRETMLRQVIEALVGVVDRRDPYASGHSAHVGFLARAVAVEMQLPERDIEACEAAGALMNFGKVLVSRAILTKTEGVTPEELQRIRDGILTSADILSPIDFGLPIVPTLRQVLERVDGKGVPLQLKGDVILMTARIVAVANAFVALVSPRAYRAGLSIAQAIQSLSKQEGQIYDAEVIAALKKYLDRDAAGIEWLTGR